jgi:hypothetical protein
MTTLVEIEEAVAELGHHDQRDLLQWLQDRLENAEPSAPDTAEWLAELAELRARTGTGVPGTPIDEIIDDLREERT